MWNTAVSRQRWSAAALILALSGCTGLSDAKYELSQKIRTKNAWEEFNACQSQPLTTDYAIGWKAGYYDVATGGAGCPPVVPPRCYWKPPVFTEHDPSKRDDWYCGFVAGAASAKSQPDFHYLKAYLPSSCDPHQSQSVMPVEQDVVPVQRFRPSEPEAYFDQQFKENPPQAHQSPQVPQIPKVPHVPQVPQAPKGTSENQKSPDGPRTVPPPPPGMRFPPADSDSADPATEAGGNNDAQPGAGSAPGKSLLRRLVDQNKQQQAGVQRSSSPKRPVAPVSRTEG